MVAIVVMKIPTISILSMWISGTGKRSLHGKSVMWTLKRCCPHRLFCTEED